MNCHSPWHRPPRAGVSRSEAEAKNLILPREMLRFAQHDILHNFCACTWYSNHKVLPGIDSRISEISEVWLRKIKSAEH
jgi:hypothetical protein